MDTPLASMTTKLPPHDRLIEDGDSTTTPPVPLICTLPPTDSTESRLVVDMVMSELHCICTSESAWSLYSPMTRCDQLACVPWVMSPFTSRIISPPTSSVEFPPMFSALLAFTLTLKSFSAWMKTSSLPFLSSKPSSLVPPPPLDDSVLMPERVANCGRGCGGLLMPL